jgi:hypothetical protein
VVLGSHGWSTQDHASVTERLIDRCSRPVLTFEEGVAKIVSGILPKVEAVLARVRAKPGT